MMRYVAAAFRNIGDTPVFVFKLFAWCVIVGVGGPAASFVSGLSTPVAALLGFLVGVAGFAPLVVLQPWLLKYYVTSGRDDTVVGVYLVRLIAAGVVYQVLVGVATMVFVLPGFYVALRLLSYLPRVARGGDVIGAVEASWEDGSGEVLPRLGQGVLYGGFSLLVVGVFAIPGALWLSRQATGSAVPFEFVLVFAGVGSVAAFFIHCVATTAFIAGSYDIVH